MWRPRIIPCLLLNGTGLVKTVRFKNPRYIGDPINAVRIFNQKKADELLFLDITATREKRTPPMDLIKKLSDECFMPFAVGGGISSIEQIEMILKAGTEKVSLNTHAMERPELVKEAAEIFGGQSIVCSMDVMRDWTGKYAVYTHSGKKKKTRSPVEVARQMEKMGAGEILLNSMERDGAMGGYDIELIRKVSDSIGIPLIASGGAGTLEHLNEAVVKGGASAVAAGSMFVYHGRLRAVLINYPGNDELSAMDWGEGH